MPLEPLTLRSSNPARAPWFGITINLGDTDLLRRIGGRTIAIQRDRPAGILIHTPGSTLEGTNPAGERRESAFLRVPRAALAAYRDPLPEALTGAPGVILVETFDVVCERSLRRALASGADLLGVHGAVLELLHRILARIEARSGVGNLSPVDGDVQARLFRVAARLREPTERDPADIAELAKAAGMSATRFKTTFKAVFGVPPRRYRAQARLEWAFDELARGRQTPTEVSYELGYSHPSKFTAAFKRHFGAVPSAVARGRSASDKDPSDGANGGGD